MRGICCAETYASVERLPAEALSLLDGGFFDTVPWWNAVRAFGVPAGAEVVFVVIRGSGRVLAVVPMLRDGTQLSGLTTPYSCAYRPLLAAGPDQPTQVLAMAAFARFCRSGGAVRLDAVPADWTGLAALDAGSRQAGVVALHFDHFGNWSEDVAGLGWRAYLAGRPGALRETIRRRLRRAEGMPDARFEVFAREDQVDAAAAIFEAVYARSWKEPEPFEAFNVGLMRAVVGCGWLRLGVWSVGCTPVAVQFWVVKDGHAIVLKLAHDEAFKAHSPGTVLTALMVRHLLDNEHVGRIDFGRGDDAYKQGWAAERRQHIGVLLVNPWRPAGLGVLLRHRAGRVKEALQAGGRRRVPRPPEPVAAGA